MSRLQKYKSLKKKKLIFMSKILVVFYLVIFSFSYLTGGTVAYFSNSNQGIMSFKAGTWYDGSKLKFVGNNGTNVDQSCPAVEISADFKNEGHKMHDTTEYEVYYTATESEGKGSPENHGSPIFEGKIQPLEKDEVTTLSFVAEKEGFYVFKVHQVEGFEGNEKEVWSEKFNIQCNKDKTINKKSSEEQESETEIKEEAVDEASQPEEKSNGEEEVVEESTSESAEPDSSQQDPTEDENNQNNEQNDNATEDNPEEAVNPSEESNDGEAADANNQPAGEGETNEETN